MSGSAQSFEQVGWPGRAGYEAAFGLVLVAILLLSTLDEGTLAPLGRGVVLAGFALLTIVNAGAALGVYVCAAILFSAAHYSISQASWVDRPDNFALLILTSYLLVGRSFGRSVGTFGATAWVVALLILIPLIHLLSLGELDTYRFNWFMRMFGIPLGLFVLLRRAALSPSELRALLLVIAVVALYLAAVSLFESLGWYTLVIPPYVVDPAFNPALEGERAGGLAMQPEWNALAISLALCVLLLRVERGLTAYGPAWVIGSGLCLLAIYLTYTRAAWLGLLLAGVPLFWYKSAARGVTLRRRLFFILFVIGFALVVLWFPSEILRSRTTDVGTVHFRFNIWAAGVKMLAQHPILGVGYGQFASHLGSNLVVLESIPSSPGLRDGTLSHNTLLSVAAELGLLGLTLYVLAVTGAYRAAAAAARDAWGQRGVAWVAGFTIVYHVNVQFVTAHELPSNLLYFGVVGALAGARRLRIVSARPKA